MNLYQSNQNLDLKASQQTEFGNKKKSLLQKIPSFFKKAFCHSIPKSPLEKSSKLYSSTPNLYKNNG
jgi:hypothetical protein